MVWSAPCAYTYTCIHLFPSLVHFTFSFWKMIYSLQDLMNARTEKYKAISQWESRQKIWLESTVKENTSRHCVAFACRQEVEKNCMYSSLSSWSTIKVKAERKKGGKMHGKKQVEWKEKDFVTLNEIFQADTNVLLVFRCCCCSW